VATSLKDPVAQEIPYAFVPKDEGLTFLEQLTVTADKQCEAFDVPFFYKFDAERKVVRFGRGTCGQWGCMSCGARNAKRWIARIIDGCNTLDDVWYFCTITAHGKWRGKHSSLLNIRSNWHKLRKRLARLAKSHDVGFFYCRVWEAHKDGSFHMHMITNFPVTERWLKNNASACGLGHQAKSEEAKNPGQVAGYCAKYMLKSLPFASEYPKGARRIEVSANWVAWYKKETEWIVLIGLGAAIQKRDSFKRNGYRIEDLALRHEEKKRKG